MVLRQCSMLFLSVNLAAVGIKSSPHPFCNRGRRISRRNDIWRQSFYTSEQREELTEPFHIFFKHVAGRLCLRLKLWATQRIE